MDIAISFVFRTHFRLEDSFHFLVHAVTIISAKLLLSVVYKQLMFKSSYI